jgi:hypothetical protein
MSNRRRFPAFRFLKGPVGAALGLVLAVSVSVTRPASSAKTVDGQTIFRFDTYGDEQLWTDTLHLNEVIETSVSAVAALGVGLKVDSTALPPGFLATHDLNDPATTVELIGLNAVLGVAGKVSGGSLKSVGVTCALCHSTVDNSVPPASAGDWTGGPTSTSTRARSSRSPPPSARHRRTCTTRGARASTTRASTSTESTGPW